MWLAKWLPAVAAAGLPLLGCTAGVLGDRYESALLAGTSVGTETEDRLGPLGCLSGLRSRSLVACGDRSFGGAGPTDTAPVASERVARSLASSRLRPQMGINTGWRMGVVYLSGESADRMRSPPRDEDGNLTGAAPILDDPWLSAWGYQFQWQYGETGTVGLVDVIPMIMGLDESLFVPSVSVLTGLRVETEKFGKFEFGVGFHYSPRAPGLDPYEDDDLHITGLGIAGSAGWAFQTPRGVNVSINYSVMKSGDLRAHGITFGWNFGL